MPVFNIHEAKTRLSQLIEAVEAGEDVVIARAGRPVARLIAMKVPPARREPGGLRGRIRMRADFDAPIAEEALLSIRR